MKILRVLKFLLLFVICLPLGLFALAVWVFRWIYIVLPIVVSYHLAFTFTVKAFGQAPTKDEYQLLFGLVGLSATICGLALRMSSASEDQNRKSIYFKIGGSLFYGTLLFVLALAMRYGYARFSQGSEWVAFFTRFPLSIVGILTFGRRCILFTQLLLV